MTFSFQINETKFENKTTVAHKKKKRQRERERDISLFPQKKANVKKTRKKNDYRIGLPSGHFTKNHLFFSPTVRNGCNLTPFLFTRKKRQICSRSHYTGTLYILIIYIIYIKMDLRRKKKPKQKKKLLFSTGIQIRRFRLLSKLEGSPFYIFVFTLSLCRSQEIGLSVESQKTRHEFGGHQNESSKDIMSRSTVNLRSSLREFGGYFFFFWKRISFLLGQAGVTIYDTRTNIFCCCCCCSLREDKTSSKSGRSIFLKSRHAGNKNLNSTIFFS